MGNAYIGHDSAVHPGYPGYLCHFPGFTHAQFNDADLCLLWNRCNGDGHPHLAVAVARGLIDSKTGA